MTTAASAKSLSVIINVAAKYSGRILKGTEKFANFNWLNALIIILAAKLKYLEKIIRTIFKKNILIIQ
jgi:hypothetical protein